MFELISFSEFKTKSEESKSFIISKKLSIDLDTIISVYLKLKNFSKYSLLLESAEASKNKGRYSVIALSPDLKWVCNNNNVEITNNDKLESSKNLTNKEIISSLEQFIDISKLPEEHSLPPICSGIFGYMNYDMVKYFENIPSHNNDEISIPEAQFIRPQILVVFDNLKDEIIINIPIWIKNQDLKKLHSEKTSLFNQVIKHIQKPIKSSNKIYDDKTPEIEFSSNFSQTEYEDIVKKAKEYITAGDVFQILPSRRFYGRFPYKGFSLYRSLRNLNPSPFLFYLNFDSFEIIGSSPEIMVRVNNEDVIIKPLAGTRKRGKDPSEDITLSKELLSDEKEKAEHLMLIDLGRNDVGRVAKDSSVKVTKFMEIEYYSHVMHISSTVEGKILPNKSCLDALIAGFPPGTVSGAPKIRAMQIISDFEPLSRSFYSGCVGYFSLHQNYMDMAIMLRTALLKDKKLYLQSGAGIVHDSIPGMEYEETSNKAQVLITAANNSANFS